MGFARSQHARSTFRLIGSEKTWDRGAALASRLQTFETEMLTEAENFGSLARINRELIAKGEALDSRQRVVLDIDSTGIPVHGQQEQSAYNGHFESTCYHPLSLFNREGAWLSQKTASGENAPNSRNWEYRIPAAGELPKLHEKHNLATPTPVSDGERIYAWSGNGQLVALDKQGHELWRRHLGQEYGSFLTPWGHGSSPTLYNDLLILLCDHQPVAYLLALDKRTGEQRWKVDQQGDRVSLSTPVAAPGRKAMNSSSIRARASKLTIRPLGLCYGTRAESGRHRFRPPFSPTA
jgi:hypothetical protein